MTLSARAVPSTDRAFRRVVEHAARQATSPDELAAQLRPLYPAVVISERQLSDEPRIFYVYRDGQFSSDSSEAWWDEPSTAYTEIDAATGVFRAVNESWADLMRSGSHELVGRPYTDFLLPEAREAATILLETVLSVGEVRSEVLMRAADGATNRVEFRAVLDGDVIRVHHRPIPPRVGVN